MIISQVTPIAPKHQKRVLMSISQSSRFGTLSVPIRKGYGPHSFICCSSFNCPSTAENPLSLSFLLFMQEAIMQPSENRRHPKVAFGAVPEKQGILDRLYRKNYKRYRHVRHRRAWGWSDLELMKKSACWSFRFWPPGGQNLWYIRYAFSTDTKGLEILTWDRLSPSPL